MKKFNQLMIVATALTIFSLSSCNDSKPTNVSLTTLNDSVNYSLGHWQGEMIASQQFADDDSDIKVKAFVKAMDAAFNEKDDKNAMYTLGIQIGKYFAEQIENGMFGDADYAIKQELLVQGFVNALTDFQEVLTYEQADSLMQVAQTRVQEKMYSQPAN